MTINELPNMKDEDDLFLQIEQFKMGLISCATGGSYDPIEYSKIRKLILSHKYLKELCPSFLKICRTIDDFWGWIKNEVPSYAERRILITNSINPMLDNIEYETKEGFLEFSQNYEEKEIIGKGGFGLVYLYEHKLLKLPFAVKIFAPAFYEGGSNELERFFQEAKILFQLNHPSIIKVYDAGMINKRPFIRMEYFDGKNLNQILDEYSYLPAEKTLLMMKNLVNALDHAHKIGIIHRDLKPSNIMAKSPNQFRIIDFGLSIFIENELHSRITKTGENIISGYYNAPELIGNPKLIDPRSDIYSIGAIWYTMLTGQPPAGSNFIDVLKSKNKKLNDDYLFCIQKCLDPISSRYNNCNDLMNDLNKIES